MTNARTTPCCAERLERVLARIDGTDPVDIAIYTRVFRDAARASAEASDRRAARGQRLGALDGRIVSLKSAIDVAGEVTLAGSPRLSGRAPATEDAIVVRQLRDAGAIVLGSVQMTELAYSGLGLNPHAPLLRNPRDPACITGGSSSGSAASVAAGLADLSIGGDTGGSIRIPASLCGVVGFKPSHGRISTAGIFPLSRTLDCFGPIARSVRECANAFGVLCGVATNPLSGTSFQQRLSPVVGRPSEGLAPEVGEAMRDAFERLDKAGLLGRSTDLDADFARQDALDRIGVFTVPELLDALREAGVDTLDGIDPMVRSRIAIHENMAAVDYVRLMRERALHVQAFESRTGRGSILVLPTVPCPPPRINTLAGVDAQLAAAALLVRNTRFANLLDLPSITLPIPGCPVPCGLMLMADRHHDLSLLAAAQAVEQALQAGGPPGQPLG